MKRKYANKKSTVAIAESSDTTMEGSVSNSDQAYSGIVPTTSETANKPGVKKRKAPKVVKLSTKPGKGKIGSKSKLKIVKGTKSSRLKSLEVAQNPNEGSEQKLVVKRPRTKPGPKPKRIKVDDKSETDIQEKSLATPSESGDITRGFTGRSSVEKTVRYKLDGSPCQKPGPKPKKLLKESEVTANKTNQQVSIQSTEKTVAPTKGKPGPKPKKIVSESTDNLENVDKSKGNLTSKGKKSPETKQGKTPASPKGKGSPKSKGAIENTSDCGRKSQVQSQRRLCWSQ